MKQLFQASLTLGGSSGVEGGLHNISAYTDEEHLSGNRKRLSKMSGQFAALKKGSQDAAAQPVQIDCNPPSTAVASANATYSYQASSNIVRLPLEDEEYIDNLVSLAVVAESTSDKDNEDIDPLAVAAAKVASKISRAITAEIDTASTMPVVPTSDAVNPAPVDPNAITAELPTLNFEPPKNENRSGLSGSFPRQNSSGRTMSHWTGRKSAGVDAWDSRVESGLKAYEMNSKYTSSYDNLPIVGSALICQKHPSRVFSDRLPPEMSPRLNCRPLRSFRSQALFLISIFKSYAYAVIYSGVAGICAGGVCLRCMWMFHWRQLFWNSASISSPLCWIPLLRTSISVCPQQKSGTIGRF